MADGYVNRPNEGGAVATVHRDIRAWVLGLTLTAFVMAVLGVWLAGVTDGVARPWAGAGFVVAMGLALVVGVSKTSSA